MVRIIEIFRMLKLEFGHQERAFDDVLIIFKGIPSHKISRIAKLEKHEFVLIFAMLVSGNYFFI